MARKHSAMFLLKHNEAHKHYRANAQLPETVRTQPCIAFFLPVDFLTLRAYPVQLSLILFHGLFPSFRFMIKAD